MSQTFAHDGLLGGLNLLKRFDNRFLIEKGERPPYPIIISNPTFQEVLSNMNRADFGILLGFAALGFPAGRLLIRAPVTSEYLRRQLFNLTWGSMIGYGFILATFNSFYRLEGYVENGLRWKRKENNLKKYDFTSDFEKNSFWGFFRLQK